MNHKALRACLMAVLLLGLTTYTFALNVKDFTYTHLGKADGMDNQRIFSLCQTTSGAIWWTSKTGVCRDNGSSVKSYSLDKGTPYNSLGGRVVKMLCKDQTIYAFDNQGSIYTYNANQDRFDFVIGVSKEIGHQVALNDVSPTADGLLLGMHDGLWLYKDGKLQQLLKCDYVNEIIRVKDQLLLCTRGGVCNRKGERLLPYNVECAYYDELSGKIWLGGYENGLYLVTTDEKGRVVRDTPVQLMGMIRQNPIRSICPYDDDTMLIGIDGQGVYQMRRDGQGQGTLLFDANETAYGVLHGNGVYSLLVDQWKNVVVGTYSGGIDIARPIGSTTAIYNHIANNRQSLLNDHVNTVMPLADDLLLMGTDNGISILNTKTGEWQHCCQGTVAISATKKPDGSVLVTTYGKGVYEIDSHANVRQVYTTADGLIKDDHVYAICYDRDGSLWVGTLMGDLLQKTKEGVYYYPIHDVQSIVQLASGQMAVGTAFGLMLVNPESHEVKELNYAPSGVTDVNPFVNHLLTRGMELWIATDGGGIYVYHLVKHDSFQITTADGLPSNHVSSLAYGGDGRIWAATEKGLAFIAREDPKQVVNVNYCYGLDREYSRAAVANLPDGNIIFGTTTGSLVIHPQDVHAINYTAKLYLKKVVCSTDQDEDFNDRVRQMLDDGELRLGYGERTFELHFESVNMRNHYDLLYRYQVGKGEWSRPTEEQHIRFTNMEPGKHLLTLQCVSRTSGVVIDTLQLTIVIARPWWNSWWMWCIYIALVALAFYGAWHVYQLHAKYMRLVLSSPSLNMDPLELQAEEPDETTEGEETTASEPVNKEERSAFIEKVTRIVAENLSDTDFNIDRLCREMAMSRTLFYIKLKSYTGNSPQDFIRVIRLERAASLLRSGHSVSDTATVTGFDNAKYFSTVFKKYFGVSPSKYC